jgi:hypothetical protein
MGNTVIKTELLYTNEDLLTLYQLVTKDTPDIDISIFRRVFPTFSPIEKKSMYYLPGKRRPIAALLKALIPPPDEGEINNEALFIYRMKVARSQFILKYQTD